MTEDTNEEKKCCCEHEHEEKENSHDNHEHGCCGGHGEGCCGHHHGEEEANKATNSGAEEYPDFPLPSPTMTTLVTSLATQAMVSMGYIPNPITNKPTFLMNQARHLIDTIQLIYDKTEGNRTEEETKTIGNAIHELQMLFVAAETEKAKREQK